MTNVADMLADSLRITLASLDFVNALRKEAKRQGVHSAELDMEFKKAVLLRLTDYDYPQNKNEKGSSNENETDEIAMCHVAADYFGGNGGTATN